MNNAFLRVIGEATQAGTWECTSKGDMIAAVEAAEDMVSSLQNALQRCVRTMTELLDAETSFLSAPRTKLRLARDAAQQVIGECSG